MQSRHSILRSRFTLWGSIITGIALLATISVIGPTASATGKDELSWSIKPGGNESRTNFSYDLEAGQEKTDAFEVTNLGSAPITLSIYAADGITSSSGALELLPAEQPSTALGAWVTVSAPEITLSPGEMQSVQFTLDVPQDIEPGDYVGGLISSYLDTSSGSTVAVDRRLANRMNVHVGGEGILDVEASELSISTENAWNPFAPTNAALSFTATNSGTVRARGQLNVTTSGPFGWGRKTQSFALEEMLPGSEVRKEQELAALWPLLIMHTELSITPEGIDGSLGSETIITAKNWNVPWGQLILLAILIAISLLIGLRRGRYYEDELDEDLIAPAAQESADRI